MRRFCRCSCARLCQAAASPAPGCSVFDRYGICIASRMRTLLGALMGAGLLLRPVQGQACTEAAMSYVYDSGAPRDADVSLNAPLIVTLNADSTAPLLDSYPELVHVATGLAVPLADPRYVMPTQFGPRRVVSFVPLAELEPTA